ncbi:unnamed protein product, partial [Prorocentrum cordatum]
MPTAAFALALAAPLAGQARGYGIDYVLHLVYLDSFLVLFVMYLGAVGSGPLPAVKRKLNATGQIIGRGFVPLAQLAWRSSPGRAPGAVAGRENLHEAYASVPHALLLQALRPYFVDWLGVPERLSAAPQGGPRGGPGPAPPAAQGARAAYDDLWHALRKSSNDEAEDVSDRFWHEPLLLVPAGGGAEGRWCTARQAIWAAPTEGVLDLVADNPRNDDDDKGARGLARGRAAGAAGPALRLRRRSPGAVHRAPRRAGVGAVRGAARGGGGRGGGRAAVRQEGRGAALLAGRRLGRP